MGNECLQRRPRKKQRTTHPAWQKFRQAARPAARGISSSTSGSHSQVQGGTIWATPSDVSEPSGHVGQLFCRPTGRCGPSMPHGECPLIEALSFLYQAVTTGSLEVMPGFQYRDDMNGAEQIYIAIQQYEKHGRFTE